jgi:hypothetical protein
LSEFVHGHIWWLGARTAQNRVNGRKSPRRLARNSVNTDQ